MQRLYLIKKQLTCATVCTLLRIMLVPAIVKTIMTGCWFEAMLLFGVAAISDCVDGSLARWYQEETKLGALLDPITDKLFIISTLIALQQTPFISTKMPTWFFVGAILKDVSTIVGSMYQLQYWCNIVSWE